MTNSASKSSETRFLPSQNSVHVAPAVATRLADGTPPLADSCVLHGATPLPNTPHIVLAQDAVKQIDTHCNSNTRVELGGVLLGRAYTHHGQTYVEVDAAIPACSDENGPIHFTFTADAWAQIQRDAEAYPDLNIVGWFHTHPDLGVFFSADDEVVQAAAFTQPWHVALVVDPVRQHANFFAWDVEQSGQIKPVAGFYELIPDKALQDDTTDLPRSIMTWQVETSSLWSTPLRQDNQFGQLGPYQHDLVSPMLGFVMGGLALFISLLTLLIVLVRTSS